MTETTFKDLGLSKKTLQWLERKWFEIPTPIQAAVIPHLLANQKNIIGQASTGTGKTAAFGLPMIDKLEHQKHIQAVILVPTRELAIQVAEEINSLQYPKDLSIVSIYWGQSYEIQNRALKKWVDIVVGTPGRIMDHLTRKTLKLEDIQYFILDEADEMLNMGFIDDIETIFKQTNPNKKVLLFSATMPREIISVAKKYMGEYDLLSIKKDNQLTTSQTEQFYIQIQERDKLEALCRFMDQEDDFYGIVFCKTKSDVDHVFARLHEKGYNAQALHGDVQQKQRENILKLFKSQKVKILIATDVAARGIDVNNISHVINFSLPQDPESYIHRIGRTWRAGKTGIAITFVTNTEYKRLMFFQKATNTSIKKIEIPAIKNVIESKKNKLKTNIKNMLEKGSHERYLPIAQELLHEKDADQIVAALLKMAYANEFNEENYNKIENFSIHSEEGKSRIFIAMGKKDGYYPKTMVDFITEETGIPSREIDDVRVLEDFSFITVPDYQSEIVLKTLKWKASKAKADKGGWSRERSWSRERRWSRERGWSNFWFKKREWWNREYKHHDRDGYKWTKSQTKKRY
jgi:ATP-dependent RNA helicase DeaD